MANYPGVRDFTGGATLLANHLDEVWTALQALFPVGYIAYMCRAATTVETFVNAAWLECNGVSVLRATYPDLNTVLSALSYPFGSADGTHMTLPDLQGRNLVAMASGGHTSVNGLGDSDGLAKASRTPQETVSDTVNISISGTTSTASGTVGAGSVGTTPNAHDHTFSGSDSDTVSDTLSGNFLVAGAYFIKAVT